MAEKTTKKRTTKSKAVKATAPVKAVRTRKPAPAASTIETPVESTLTAKSKALRIRKSYLFTFLGILLLVALFLLFRNYIVAATVNGQPIARWSVVSELEKQGGKQALESLITKKLIIQKAEEKKVTVSDKDVTDEIKTIESNLSKQGQKLDQVLQLQGMTKTQLVEQIRLQKMIEKMVGKVAVTDKEIDDYITANQESLPQDQDEKTKRQTVKQQLERQKLNEKAQAFLENLRKDAKVTYFVNY